MGMFYKLRCHSIWVHSQIPDTQTAVSGFHVCDCGSPSAFYKNYYFLYVYFSLQIRGNGAIGILYRVCMFLSS